MRERVLTAASSVEYHGSFGTCMSFTNSGQQRSNNAHNIYPKPYDRGDWLVARTKSRIDVSFSFSCTAITINKYSSGADTVLEFDDTIHFANASLPSILRFKGR